MSFTYVKEKENRVWERNVAHAEEVGMAKLQELSRRNGAIFHE